jgi:DNA polymerase III delta prime subunit
VPDELTSDQKLALNVAGSQALMYLWGPPGTGKTVTLAALAWSLACSNRRVLIVSHTHRAVDGVLEGLCQRVSQQVPSALSSHAILRIGPIARSSLREKFGAEISFEQVLARNESTVVHQLSALKQEQTSIRNKACEASNQLSLWDARERLQDELEVLKESLAESSLELKGVGGRILAADTRPSTADTAPDGDIRESISLLEKGLTEIERTFTAESREEIESLWAQLNNRQHELATAIATLERSLRVLRAEILSDARIVATTATQAFLRSTELVDFDTIILDEASMLPLPLVYRLCGMAKRSVVIAGDFRQLPPISVSRSEIVAQWFARDVFEAAGIVDSVNLGKTQPHLVKLTTQFRSRDELCSLINHRFYGGDLSSRYTDREPMECPPAMAFLKDYPIVLVDSSDLAPVGHSVGRSKANLPHALLVRLLCSRLSKSASKQRDSLVGVIAPYRAQVELIEDLLQEAGITGIEVGTIHRFQGEERKIIILDLTESPPHSLGSFFSSTSLKDVGAKLLNVALSRAESNLLLVANVSFLRSKTRDTHILRGILDDVERVAFRLTTTELCTALEEQLVPTIHPRVSS